MTKSTKQYEGFDPFARSTPVDAGMVSDQPNNIEKESEAIKPFIPSEASTDEGYKKMLKIMGKKDPDVVDKPKIVSETPNSPVIDEGTPNIGNPYPPTVNSEKSEEEFTNDEILPLLDALLMKGVVRETFRIRGAEVVFRTQFFWEDQLAMKLTEEHLAPGSLRDTGALVNSLYVLSMNLEQFGGNYFKPISRGTPEELRESMEARANFLQTLPSVLINYLWEKRSKFFKKVEYISKNFDELIKAF